MNTENIELNELKIKEVNVESETFKSNESVSFSIIPKNLEELEEKLVSKYDYDEFEIVIDIEAPSGKTDRIYSYFNQDFEEERIPLENMSLDDKIEGDVFVKDGQDYLLNLYPKGLPYYKANYTPKESGKYSYSVKSYYNNSTLIETFTGNFDVTNGENTKGSIHIADNKKTFCFEDGSTYAAVGENVAWHTSVERKYGDYEIIFNSLAQNNANYARVWLAGFGFSLFWDDVENYDTKLDKAYQLDKIFELARSLDIYIDLTIFHHGMFSTKNDPMWPNKLNTYYTDQYGANPYSEKISKPADFFKNSYAKKWCKNYLKYICARWGYSNNLLSFDLFNEVDWTDGYTTSAINSWHDEMAKYLKKIDCMNHMVTTSLGNDNLLTSSCVFSLNSIDYVNVHKYGVENYSLNIPSNAKIYLSRFKKPVIYQEVGYWAYGGADQMEKDKKNISLHQEIWAGVLSTSASGMNWWWDSWIEIGNCYEYYLAPGKFAKIMNLNGQFELAHGNQNISLTNSNVRTTGYLFKDRAYLYVFHSEYSLENYNQEFSSEISISNMLSGEYKVEYFDTFSGEILNSITVSQNDTQKINISVSTTNDIALIITKI